MGVETEISWKPGLINNCVDCNLSGCPVRSLGQTQQEILKEFSEGRKSLHAAFKRINSEIYKVGAKKRGGPLYKRDSTHESVETVVRCPWRECPVGSRTATLTSNISR